MWGDGGKVRKEAGRSSRQEDEWTEDNNIQTHAAEVSEDSDVWRYRLKWKRTDWLTGQMRIKVKRRWKEGESWRVGRDEDRMQNCQLKAEWYEYCDRWWAERGGEGRGKKSGQLTKHEGIQMRQRSRLIGHSQKVKRGVRLGFNRKKRRRNRKWIWQ